MSAKTLLSSLVFVLAAGLASPAAPNTSLRDVKRVFVEPIGNGFEQQLKLEIVRQFQGAVTLTEDKRDAEAILKGLDNAGGNKGVGKKISGKLGMNDVQEGSLVLYARDGTTILWMETAGDRYFWLGPMTPESKKKIAERLVKKLRRSFKEAH
jgi:hypothetical protein